MDKTRQAEINAQARKVLESLTPGGSEFHNNPEMCESYIRERLRNGHKAMKDRVRLQQEIDRLKGLYLQFRPLIEGYIK